MSDRQIIVRNWDKFQHKDVWRKSGGKPPWIKAYTRLLHDEEYMQLTLPQRALLHGIWLMYASTGGALTTTRCRRLLSTNKAETRHFYKHLDAIADAGFIEFVSQPKRESGATRVEKSREENPPSFHRELQDADSKEGGRNPLLDDNVFDLKAVLRDVS